MKGEVIFKRIISGQAKDPVSSIARTGLGVLSKLYEAGVVQRNKKFEDQSAITHATVPVISVGNITAGGTGKTPMVRYICQFLEAQGCKPSVLSRGYKAANNEQSIIVSRRGHIEVSPAVSGDEAYLLAKGLGGTNVVIGRHRAESATIATEQLGSDVIVLDDGFQHRQLHRDLDIVLIDAANPFGYGHVLPRGLLREPLEGLKRANIILLTKTDQVPKDILYGIKQKLNTYAPMVPVFETIHKPLGVITIDQWAAEAGDLVVNQDELAPEVQGHSLLAISGIGRPESFKATLQSLGFTPVDSLDFGDHHEYTEDDLIKIYAKAFELGITALITTEKDAVKLSQLRALKDLKLPVYVVPIGIEFVGQEQEFKDLIQAVGKKDK
ncbi:tetraacyldisaccharide 4'-kinase [uncultured Veillonella sp.]|uniref:tetraacyldisaccharide 4'-kinase n=1 Tax=uncultured Veillonella sp. TaxID=159268 RepID=UPI0025FBA0B1|nr:tetraacyldisaccharide 4'-kinase [uncultured Veillonella sp.]MDY3973674.1 tetraacyldisaccharide 4'-kinase [Veillonella caviae]